MKDRKGSFLNSLLMSFRKTSEQDESNAQDLSRLESRQRLEKRIELALGDLIEPLQTAPEL